MDPNEIVRRGYDRISRAYRDDEGLSSSGNPTDYPVWLGELMPLLPAGAPVLDLGCGCGLPADRILVDHGFGVTGLDFSPVQIERARRLVPEAEFICGNMTEVEFPVERFAAVVSLYAIIHLPLGEQPRLFADLHRWLRKGGYLMAILGWKAWTGTEDMLGVDMYWSHADEDTYRSWLTDLGFDIRWTRFIPEGDGGHCLFLAQKVR